MVFSNYSNFKRNFCNQTVENLTRRRVLRRLNMVLQCLPMSHKKDARLIWVSPPVKIFFTDHSKAVLLLWILCVMYISCLSCCHVSLFQPCGHLTASLSWCDVFLFLSLPCGVLGQVSYLIVYIPDLCLLPYFT